MDLKNAAAYRDAINSRLESELTAFRLRQEGPASGEGTECGSACEQFDRLGENLAAYLGSSLVDVSGENFRLPELEILPETGYFGPLKLSLSVLRDRGVVKEITAVWRADFLAEEQFETLDASLEAGPPPSRESGFTDRDLTAIETVFRDWLTDPQNAERRDLQARLHQLARSVEVYIDHCPIAVAVR